MKKLLTASSAFVLALPMMSTAVSADIAHTTPNTPRLTISGNGSVQYYAFGQSVREGNGGKGGGHHLGFEDGRLNFDVFGKADNALGFKGLEYSLLFGVSGNPDEANSMEQARIQLKTADGTVQMGNTRGVDDFMSVGAFTIQGGSGMAFDGNMKRVLNITHGAVVTTDLTGTTKEATKISYITPRVEGVQLGFSFTPQGEHRGERKLSSFKGVNSTQFSVNQLALGANYKKSFSNGVDAKAAFTMITSPTRLGARGVIPIISNANSVAAANVLAPVTSTIATTKQAHRVMSYALGGTLGYKGFEVGGEFVDNGKSLQPVGSSADSGKVITGAVSYTYGPDKFSASVFTSSRNPGAGFSKTKANVYSLAYERPLAPGLKVFAEGNVFEMKADTNYISQVNNIVTVANRPQMANTPIDNTLVNSDNATGNVSAYAGQEAPIGNNRGQVLVTGVKMNF